MWIAGYGTLCYNSYIKSSLEGAPMNNNYPQIQELLHQKADYQAGLNLLPYDGTPLMIHETSGQFKLAAIYGGKNDEQ